MHSFAKEKSNSLFGPDKEKMSYHQRAAFQRQWYIEGNPVECGRADCVQIAANGTRMYRDPRPSYNLYTPLMYCNYCHKILSAHRAGNDIFVYKKDIDEVHTVKYAIHETVYRNGDELQLNSAAKISDALEDLGETNFHKYKIVTNIFNKNTGFILSTIS
jgi:hypothetical protein